MRVTVLGLNCHVAAHALRGKDFAAAQIWDDIKEQARGEVSKGVN
jgi:hypothetical protein